MSNYVDNINDCLLSVFRDILINGDYKLLLIDGEYDQEKAKDSWLKIMDEYNEAIKKNGVNIQFELQKQLHVKRIQYDIINQCVFIISQGHTINILADEKIVDYTEFIETINHYKFKFNKDGDIAEECKKALHILGNYKTTMKSLELKINKINEETKELSFEDVIAQVEIGIGFQINEKTTVKKFTGYLNHLIKKNKNEPRHKQENR